MEQLEDGYRSLSVRESLKHVENNLSTGPLDEFQEADLSEEDETFDGALTKTYDAIPMDSIQQRILDVSADPQTASKSMHVLMFGIYTMAVTSLTDEDCMSYFNEKRDELIKKYQNAAKLALVQARFMRSSDMTTLQGFMLHLFSCLNFNVDPRALFCLTGIAVRIAQRMGLNFDGTAYGLPPFETEMRRRLWWQIIFLDSRVGELAGCPPSMLQHLRTTRIPLNVNDSDLFPGMREPPVEHTGITEMIHVLPRCEIIKLYLEAKLTNVPARVRIPDSQIDEFEAFIEEKYLKWCINAELEDRAWKQIMVSSTAVRERMKLEKESVSNPHQPAPFKDELRMAIANLTTPRAPDTRLHPAPTHANNRRANGGKDQTTRCELESCD
ncbi:putative Uncharacterized transcriptional regulatory protein [Glarea lozoyensis 74030]|uniref:Putative Uncharacterized transcriptional regulatory protein n=1 Tax=Glarea lozoyensis (strain ATCC 74030 / MF5533) TaxID=1104152 RepID=H0EFT7_GLAL7|nr:putative Uncharacterized transcriptional regulatory protein [Glarea lozoyensis 74030]